MIIDNFKFMCSVTVSKEFPFGEKSRRMMVLLPGRGQSSPDKMSSLRCNRASFPRLLDLLQQILHLEVQIGLPFLCLFAEHLVGLDLFLFVLLQGLFSLLLILQVLLGLGNNK